MSEEQTAEISKLKYQIEQLNKQVSELSVKNEMQYNELNNLRMDNRRLEKEKEKDRLFVIVENLSVAVGRAGK